MDRSSGNYFTCVPEKKKIKREVMSKDWDKIEQDYSNNIPFLELIQFIKSSGISKRVYAITSLNKLIFSSNDSTELFKEELHITFHDNINMWHFVYYTIPIMPPEFDRLYEADKGIEQFKNIIKMIKW
jgi:hypothetical protein